MLCFSASVCMGKWEGVLITDGNYKTTKVLVGTGVMIVVIMMMIPVVKPIRAFSPPSNPATHHSLMGPMFFVGTPPLRIKRNTEAQ